MECENSAVAIMNLINQTHGEETVESIENQKKLMPWNKELLLQLISAIKVNLNLTELFVQKDKGIMKLEESPRSSESTNEWFKYVKTNVRVIF